MKQVTYTVRGLVIETMIPAIKASCESLAGVRNVRVSTVDTDTARIALIVDGEINEELDDSPENLNSDPYGAWIIKVENVTGEEELLDAAAYEAFCAEEG